MTICAVIQSYVVPNNTIDVVINKIVAEPTEQAPEGTYLVEVPDGVMCDIGWVWDGQNFTDPTPAPTPEPTPEPMPDEEVI